MRGEHVATYTLFIGRAPELQGANTARVISGEDHTAKRDIGCHLGRENRLFVKRFSAQSQRFCHDKKVVLTLEDQPPVREVHPTCNQLVGVSRGIVHINENRAERAPHKAFKRQPCVPDSPLPAPHITAAYHLQLTCIGQRTYQRNELYGA